MESRRILFVEGPRLLWEMLKHVIDKTPDLQVVDEVTDLSGLSSKVEQTGAHWVILPLLSENEVPGIAESLLLTHPALNILAVATDGSEIKMKCAVAEEEQSKDLTLDELIALLRKDSPRDPVVLDVEEVQK